MTWPAPGQWQPQIEPPHSFPFLRMAASPCPFRVRPRQCRHLLGGGSVFGLLTTHGTRLVPVAWVCRHGAKIQQPWKPGLLQTFTLAPFCILFEIISSLGPTGVKPSLSSFPEKPLCLPGPSQSPFMEFSKAFQLWGFG
jgi:hypothetical protein